MVFQHCFAWRMCIMSWNYEMNLRLRYLPSRIEVFCVDIIQCLQIRHTKTLFFKYLLHTHTCWHMHMCTHTHSRTHTCMHAQHTITQHPNPPSTQQPCTYTHARPTSPLHQTPIRPLLTQQHQHYRILLLHIYNINKCFLQIFLSFHLKKLNKQ